VAGGDEPGEGVAGVEVEGHGRPQDPDHEAVRALVHEELVELS
jgi:hypothetical protein